MRALFLRFVPLLAALGLLGVSYLPAHAADAARLQIIGIDPSAAPEMEMLVTAYDADGRPINGLSAAAFSVEEDGQVIPGDLLQLAPDGGLPAHVSVAIVADMTESLGADEASALREAARGVITGLLDGSASREVGLFVPRSAAGQAPQTVDFTSERSAVLAQLDALQPLPPGPTDLYNSVAIAVNASAERAAANGGQAVVLVLSDGLDRTSIVGVDGQGANQAAQIAEQRHVTVHAFGFGRDLERSGTYLVQLADRSGGSYQARPDGAGVADLVQRISAVSGGGAYRLRYRSALPADGREHQLTLRLNRPPLTLNAEQRYTLPLPWDETTPVKLGLTLDSARYPQISLLARPVNRLRRTLPALTPQQVQLALNDQPLAVPITIDRQPLDPLDPAATQSLALVLDTGGEQAAALQGMARTLLGSQSATPSRAALFAPGLLDPTPQFTHDHNALLNRLTAASQSKADPAALRDTLLVALDAVAKDADASQRPAYLVLFSNAELAPDSYSQVVALARNRGVSISIVAAGTPPLSLARLAQVTQGQALTAPDEGALRALAQRIEADRGARYRLQFRLPLLADGQRRTLSVQIGAQKATLPLVPLVAGATQVAAPTDLVVPTLGFVFVAGALILAGTLPTLISERRRRCPTCQRVRRPSWGENCLFCEHSAHQVPAVDSPLEAFAQQGAALLQAVEKPALLDAPQPAALTPAQQARVQTHSDFWGPEPGAAPEPPRALTLPPAQEQQPPPPLPIFALPSEAPGGRYAWVDAAAREPSHTDFWGPLPETGAATDQSQPEPQQSSEPAPAAEAASLAKGTRRRATVKLPDLEDAAPVEAAGEPLAAPVSAAEQPATGTHTDFWGPLPEAAAPATDDSNGHTKR